MSCENIINIIFKNGQKANDILINFFNENIDILNKNGFIFNWEIVPKKDIKLFTEQNINVFPVLFFDDQYILGANDIINFLLKILQKQKKGLNKKDNNQELLEDYYNDEILTNFNDDLEEEEIDIMKKVSIEKENRKKNLKKVGFEKKIQKRIIPMKSNHEVDNVQDKIRKHSETIMKNNNHQQNIKLNYSSNESNNPIPPYTNHHENSVNNLKNDFEYNLLYPELNIDDEKYIKDISSPLNILKSKKNKSDDDLLLEKYWSNTSLTEY